MTATGFPAVGSRARRSDMPVLDKVAAGTTCGEVIDSQRKKDQVQAPEDEPMIHVIAIITAKSGMREDILREFRANMPAVHAEKGCIEYGPATDTPDIGKFQTPFGADTFVVIEKWESPEALKAHAAAPHMAAYAAKTKDMIASRVIHVLSPAA
jgi:quinol monooxygenase YgiN